MLTARVQRYNFNSLFFITFFFFLPSKFNRLVYQAMKERMKMLASKMSLPEGLM